MSDTVFYLLDALLGAARGMLISSKAKNLQEQYGLDKDPRGTMARTATSPLGGAAFNLITGYALTRDFKENAKDISSARESGRYF